MKITESRIRRIIREELLREQAEYIEFEDGLEVRNQVRDLEWSDLYPPTPPRNPESKTLISQRHPEYQYTVDVIETSDGQKITMGKTSELLDFINAADTTYFVDVVEGSSDCIIGNLQGLANSYNRNIGAIGGSPGQGIDFQSPIYLVPIGAGGYFLLGSSGDDEGDFNDGMAHVVWDDGGFWGKLPTSLGPSGVWVKKMRLPGFGNSTVWVLDKRHIKPNCMPKISGSEILKIYWELRKPTPPPPEPDWIIPGGDAVKRVPVESGSERHIYAKYENKKVPIISLERYEVLRASSDSEDQDLADRIMSWRDGNISSTLDQEGILNRIKVRFPIPGEYYTPDDLQDDWKTR